MSHKLLSSDEKGAAHMRLRIALSRKGSDDSEILAGTAKGQISSDFMSSQPAQPGCEFFSEALCVVSWDF